MNSSRYGRHLRSSPDTKPAPKKPRAPRSARNKMMDLLALRDHSEREIRKKLKEREFAPEEIEKAIIFGRENRWLPDSEDENQKLSQKMAIGLHRKGKGHLYINHFLKEKGLPPITQDPDIELEKALRLLENKPSLKEFTDRSEKQKQKGKLIRFLTSRGFTLDTISKAIK